MKKFTIDYKKSGHHLLVTLAGRLNEDVELSSIDLSGIDTVTIDTQNVFLINSNGTRNWVVWIQNFPADLKLVFENCSRAVIDQANLISGFIPKNSIIESFFVPYQCEGCNRSQNFLMERNESFDAHHVNAPETISCPHCGADMVIDVLESVYFQFLESHFNVK